MPAHGSLPLRIIRRLPSERAALVLHRMWVDGSEFRWSKTAPRFLRLPEAAAENAGKTAIKEINAFCFGRKMSSRGRRVG